MTNLVAAYQANDILAFERILRTNRRARASHPRPRAVRQAHADLASGRRASRRAAPAL